jgi:hypothetical protein
MKTGITSAAVRSPRVASLCVRFRPTVGRAVGDPRSESRDSRATCAGP